MDIVREIVGQARITVGWHVFDAVPYRLDVIEERGRRRLAGGNLGGDTDVMAALEEFGESVIDLEGGLGSFSFIVVDVASRSVKILRPITRSGGQDRDWR